MSNEPKDKLDRLKSRTDTEVLELAWEELRALCGSGVPRKEFLMTVPVDADRDSDIVLGEALMRLEKLILDAEK